MGTFGTNSYNPAMVASYGIYDTQLNKMIGEWLNPKFRFAIKKVIFNDPATIVYWMDGTKTVVKCGDDDWFEEEKGLAMAIAKRAYGDKGNYNDVFKQWCE